MKKLTSLLLRRRVAGGMLLLALLFGVGASIGWVNQQRYQLGGTFIGSGGAGIWNAMQTPLDPAGRTAALRISLGAHSPGFAGLLAALGATPPASDSVGEMEMISRDTATYNTVSHARMQVPGNPLQIHSIFVMSGTVKFTGPDSGDVTYTLNVYPVNVAGFPNADVDGDGYPDPGAQPIVIPGVLPIQGLDHAKRVPLP